MEGVYYENAKRFWNRLMTLLEINLEKPETLHFKVYFGTN